MGGPETADLDPASPGSGRRLVLLNHPADVGAEAIGTDWLVLDPTWTPDAETRPDLIPVRPWLWAVIRDHDVHNDALSALDAWAERAGMAQRLRVGGTTWWYHARGFLRLDLHEMALWRHVFALVAPAGRYDQIEVPDDRPNLVAALEATALDGTPGPQVILREAATGARRFGGGKPSRSGTGRARPWYRRLASRGVRTVRRTLNLPELARARLLRQRFGRMVHQRPEVLAIMRGESFHVVSGPGGEERFDPIVAPVLRRLAERGHTIAEVILGSPPQPDSEVLHGEGPMPIGVLTQVLTRRSERIDDPAELTRRLDGIEFVPLRLAGMDIGPAIVDIMGSLGTWFARQRRELLVAERVLATLRPRALLTGWEAARTAWLEAARSQGVPSIAIQHGVIYRNSPDYYRPAAPGRTRPTLTCVFGAYERGLLVKECGYAPTTVLASGSPRLIPPADPEPVDPVARQAVRDGLGIAAGDRMLVISGARHSLGEELYSTTIFGRLLDGPLPGVHLVVKLHPEEELGEHYEALVAGLAAAGGYPPTPVSVVRDIDLFDLLRAADAHLGIYSTVLTDAVVVGTPNMVAVGQAWSDLVGYVDAGVAQAVSSADDVRAFMLDPRPPTAEARAAFLREHYAPGGGTDRIAEAVIAAAAGRTRNLRQAQPGIGEPAR